ncbi:hypothetical protein [Chachezhania sediminis]|uniref:hypothetical protein n=1 Tax=Chachezhania sediminis TaxID=2599291 RepID=UPI00131EBE89|nr:hypothetical protein [Chachezhania sediminis]
MTDPVSALFSLIGLGSTRSSQISAKRNAALALSAETIGLVGQLSDFLTNEVMRLTHRQMDLVPANPELWEAPRQGLLKVVNEYQEGMRKLEADREILIRGNSMSLRKWDEAIGILQTQKAAMEREFLRQRQITAQLHEIFDKLAAIPPEERYLDPPLR